MSKPYYKRNYLDALEKLIPAFYIAEDTKGSLDSADMFSVGLVGDIQIIDNFHTIFDVNDVTPVSDLLGWDGQLLTNLPPYFIRQNETTLVSPESFDLDILKPLGYSISDYQTKEEFKSFLTTFLSNIRIGIGSTTPEIHSLTQQKYGETKEETYEYLLNSLGLFFVFNYEAAAGISICDYLPEVLANLWEGETLGIGDALRAVKTYIWNNQATTLVPFNHMFGAGVFASGTGTHTSGTQQLDKLLTINDILHVTNFSQETDTFVRDCLESYYDSDTAAFGMQYDPYLKRILISTVGVDADVAAQILKEEKTGNLKKFLRAASLLISDVDDQIVSLETIHSIQDCPSEYLPYLADSIGWTLYTNNSDSHRRQLRDALSLLQRKGTKQGLEALFRSVLPAFNIDFTEKYNEFFESYLPNQLYYLLRTESNVKSFDTWNQQEALDFARGEFSNTSIDENVRLVIDNILLDACERFSHLFSIRGTRFTEFEPSKFRFSYRGRVLNIPPFEDERFYKDCDVTFEFVDWLTDRLICLGVPEKYVSSWKDWILNNTLQGHRPAKYYNNSWVILTSGLQLPPNYSDVFAEFEQEKVEFMPYWSGKSSHFNLSVSSGSFTDSFFTFGSFSRDEFFDALRATKDFIPAKAIQRLHVDLVGQDYLFTNVTLCPRVNYEFKDFMSEGAFASYQLSSLDMRDASLGLLTGGVPSFKRNADVDVSGPVAAIGGGRNAKRRRNFVNALNQGEMFERTGFNQPIFKNIATSGAGEEYAVLGLNPSTLQFAEASDSVWDACESLDSPRSFSGVYTSATFPCRGADEISKDECHLYTYRDDYSDFKTLLYKIERAKVEANAKLEYTLNNFLYQRPWFNELGSLFNEMWSNHEIDLDYVYDVSLDKFKMNRGIYGGMAYLYHHIYKPIADEGISNSTLQELEEGGLSVLSQTFGPVYFNAYLTAPGANENRCRTIFDDKENLMVSASPDRFLVSSVSSTPVGTNEYRDVTYISGVEVTDSVSSTNNKISVYSLSSDDSLLDSDSPLLHNTLVTIKARERFPRLRYTFNYGDENLLFPEHTYVLDMSSVFLRDNSNVKPTGQAGIWIHTEPEQDYHGNWVFWNYMPNGKWEMLPAQGLTRSFVTDSLCHKQTHAPGELKGIPKSCDTNEFPKQSLLALSNEDFTIQDIKIDTRNQPIAVPLYYYQSYKQVHRMNQKYVVEVFPFTTIEDTVFWTLNGIKMYSKTANDLTKIGLDVSCNDFRSIQKTTEDYIRFIKSDGTFLPSGVDIEIIGDRAYYGDDPLTLEAGVSKDGQSILKPILYETVNAVMKQEVNQSGNLMPERPFEGFFKQLNFSKFGTEFPSLRITGKKLGSNVVYNDVATYDITPKEVLTILRAYKEMADTQYSRDSALSETDFELSGGARMNYRTYADGAFEATNWSNRRPMDITVIN